MSRRRLAMVLASLILSTSAFAVPAAAAGAAPSPGCEFLDSYGPVGAYSSVTYSPIGDFYAGDVVTVTVSDFLVNTDVADIAAYMLEDLADPSPTPFHQGTLSATAPTLSWEVPQAGRLGFVIATKAAVNGQTSGTAVFSFTCQKLVLSTFEAPVDAAPMVNLAQAGRTIPFKFTVTDHEGAPITDLTTDDVTPVTDLSAGACGTTANVSVVETYSSGAGALTHLGNGHYLYTLQTDKTWRGTCGTVGVSVRGVEQTADFQFRS